MKKIFLLFVLVLGLNLYGYTDSDMDGVEDAKDKCPNTPLTDIVDINGCSIKSLVSNQHYDIILGASYFDSDARTINKTTTLSTSVQVDYYYKKFSLQAYTSYFKTDGSGFSDSGLYDSFVGGGYRFWLGKNLQARLGLGVILPTYNTTLNNNKTDYSASLNLSYQIKKINLFVGYRYTLVNDTDVVIVDSNGTRTNVLYQNTNSVSMGIGYYVNSKLYLSGAYNQSNSIYKGVKDLKTANIYGFYSFTKNYFGTLSYSRGISKSATKNYVSARIGYYF